MNISHLVLTGHVLSSGETDSLFLLPRHRVHCAMLECGKFMVTIDVCKNV